MPTRVTDTRLLDDWEERVNAEGVVDHHARDAHHCGAAVVALRLRVGTHTAHEVSGLNARRYVLARRDIRASAALRAPTSARETRSGDSRKRLLRMAAAEAVAAAALVNAAAVDAVGDQPCRVLALDHPCGLSGVSARRQGGLGQNAAPARSGGGSAAYVELEGLDLRVVVADPRGAAHIAGSVALGRGAEGQLQEHDERDDLQPANGGDSGVGGERTARDVRELEVERFGEVARPAEARLSGDHAEGGEHGNAAVLDLQLHIALIALARVGHRRRKQVERVVHAEGLRDTNLARSLHAHRAGAGQRRNRREGLR